MFCAKFSYAYFLRVYVPEARVTCGVSLRKNALCKRKRKLGSKLFFVTRRSHRQRQKPVFEASKSWRKKSLIAYFLTELSRTSEKKPRNESAPAAVAAIGKTKQIDCQPWSSGYGRRLIFWSLWDRIPAPYTGWTFFTHICCKNC